MVYEIWSILQKSAMRNNKFVIIVIRLIILIVVVGLAPPAFT